MDNPQPVEFIRWIVLLPLAGAAINFLLGPSFQKKFGRRAVALVGCGAVIASLALGPWALFRMLAVPPSHRFMLDDLWRWFDIGGLRMDVAFWLDPLAMVRVC